MFENWISASPGNGGKTAEKWPISEPLLGHFPHFSAILPDSRVRPQLIFGHFLPPFGPET